MCFRGKTTIKHIITEILSKYKIPHMPYQFNIPPYIKEKVFRFQVSVNDAHSVEVIKGL